MCKAVHATAIRRCVSSRELRRHAACGVRVRRSTVLRKHRLLCDYQLESMYSIDNQTY